MGVFLVLILLLAAIVITAILTLNAVNKRTREFGTLEVDRLGQPRLIRQVMAESLSTGTIGAAAGVMLGFARDGDRQADAADDGGDSGCRRSAGLGRRLGVGPARRVRGPRALDRQATEAAARPSR